MGDGLMYLSFIASNTSLVQTWLGTSRNVINMTNLDFADWEEINRSHKNYNPVKTCMDVTISKYFGSDFIGIIVLFLL